MKDLAIINSLESGIWTAKRAFMAAVVENLKEVGKVLTIVGDGDNEELGYPEGLLMSMQNKHGIMVDCVYDLIKMDGDKVMLHQSYWDDGEDDYWQHSEDIGTDDLLTIYSAIDWEDFIPKGESEDKPKMWCVTYVGLSDSEYKANGYSEVALYATMDAAKAKLKAWRDNEIAELKEQERDYEILEDEDDECRISWCGHGEQVRIEVHEVELNK